MTIGGYNVQNTLAAAAPGFRGGRAGLLVPVVLQHRARAPGPRAEPARALPAAVAGLVAGLALRRRHVRPHRGVASTTPTSSTVVIHSYRHRHGNAPGDPRFDAVERRLAERPPITVPTVVLHGGNDGASGPPAAPRASWRSSRPGRSGGSWPAWGTSCPASGRPRWWRHFRPFSDRLSAMRIEIICTGDEVLTGKIVNTNFSYMSQKLEDVGLVRRVGHHRRRRPREPAARVPAGRRARRRGHRQRRSGPTVDDLSQEIAAKAAGVELVLNEEWLTRMEEFFHRRSRVCRPTTGSRPCCRPPPRCIDNPIGTACGFALDIGKARFFFTPGVPRELRRMLEEQIIPRLLARSGLQTAILLKRFHSYGLGESHVDTLLTGVEALVPGRQREARLPRPLPAARDQADRARHRHGRRAAQARRRSSARCASGSATSSWPRTTRRWKAWCCGALARAAGLAGRRRDVHRRPDRRPRRATCPAPRSLPPRHRRARSRPGVRRRRHAPVPEAS